MDVEAHDSHAAAEPMDADQEEPAAQQQEAADVDMQGPAEDAADSVHGAEAAAAAAGTSSAAAAGPTDDEEEQGHCEAAAGAEPAAAAAAAAAAAPAAKSNLVSAIRSFVQGGPKKEPAAPAQGKVKTKVGALLCCVVLSGTTWLLHVSSDLLLAVLCES
jgi:hypothetical protein